MSKTTKNTMNIRIWACLLCFIGFAISLAQAQGGRFVQVHITDAYGKAIERNVEVALAENAGYRPYKPINGVFNVDIPATAKDNITLYFMAEGYEPRNYPIALTADRARYVLNVTFKDAETEVGGEVYGFDEEASSGKKYIKVRLIDTDTESPIQEKIIVATTSTVAHVAAQMGWGKCNITVSDIKTGPVELVFSGAEYMPQQVTMMLNEHENDYELEVRMKSKTRAVAAATAPGATQEIPPFFDLLRRWEDIRQEEQKIGHSRISEVSDLLGNVPASFRLLKPEYEQLLKSNPSVAAQFKEQLLNVGDDYLVRVGLLAQVGENPLSLENAQKHLLEYAEIFTYLNETEYATHATNIASQCQKRIETNKRDEGLKAIFQKP